MTIKDAFTYEEILGYQFGYHPFKTPKMISHVYYIDKLLIDTGHSRMKKTVFNELKGLEVDQIFITHHHEDHTGNLAEFQDHFQCPTYSSELCKELMKSPPKISLSQQLIWGDRPANHKLISKENTISTEHYQFQIIPIPGHAIDMVALYEPNKRWLFSADLFVNTYIGYFLHNESTIDQINSIRTILELDFEVLLCSHNPQFKMGKERLKKKLKFLEKFYEQVEEEYQKNKDANKIFSALKLKEYWSVRFLSNGHLSKMNMVKSVIRDIENIKRKSNNANSKN